MGIKPDFKKLEEWLPNMSKPDMQPFEWFTFSGRYSLNGYVVVPDYLPLDYMDEIYDSIDAGSVGGLTFGGYFSMIEGQLTLLYLEQGDIFKTWNCTEEQLKILSNARNKSVRVIGFDDNHMLPNQSDAEDGAKYVAQQLKNLYGGRNNG